MRQALGFISNRLLAMSWAGWRAMMEQVDAIRSKVLPFVNRMLFKLQSIVYAGWLEYVELQKAERQAARRALGFWAGSLSLRVLLALKQYAVQRMRHRHNNETATWARDSRIVTKHLQAWHGAWEARHTERKLLTRSLAFMTRTAEVKCLATWRQVAEEAAFRVAMLEHSYKRWRSMELRQGFVTLVEQLTAERAAMDLGRRVVMRLVHRNLTRALLGWVEMAEARAAKLAAMSVIGETMINKGKRAALNNLIELMNQGNELKRISTILRLREVRHILGKWAGLGRNHRLMISTLRRLASRELTRGWMAWRGDYAATINLESAAHQRALGFGARLLHMEAARGFSAIKEQYSRILELRVYLKRVANPRAAGMLRRWRELAAERVESLRKLRRAYSMIANGVLTRITLAWRELVEKRNVVKQRVARLLGKMLDSTFHGWVRLVRRRVACRAAAAEVLAARKERVWTDYLRRWTYHAHLTSALGHAMRSLFVRNTSVIFREWHAWAHEEAEDRAALEAVQEAVERGGEGADELLQWSGRRWRRLEEATAFDEWHAQADFFQKATMLTGLAIAHSAQALARWAFDEYAYAVKVQVEERAAGLFWSQGMLKSSTRFWRDWARTEKVKSSQSKSALLHFLSRLEMVVLCKWRDAVQEWKHERLGELASLLHFEGTLTVRVFLAWRNFSHLNAWRERQVKMGIAKHFMGMAALVFKSWSTHAHAIGLARALCDNKYEATMKQLLSFGLHKWAAEARDMALLASAVGGNSRRVLLREGVRTWREYAFLAGLMGGHAESSQEHADYCLKRKAMLRWSQDCRLLVAIGSFTDELTHGRATVALRRCIELWRALARLEGKLTLGGLRALEAWTRSAEQVAFDKWSGKATLCRDEVAALRRAAAAFFSAAWFKAFQTWATFASRRVALLQGMKRSLSCYTRGLETRVVRAWKTVLDVRAKRQQTAAQFLLRLMNRHLALTLAAWQEFIAERRQLKAAAVAMSVRMANKEATAALTEWKAVWLEACHFSQLSDRVFVHLEDMMSRVLSARFAEWAKAASVGAVCKTLLGRTGRKELASGFYTLWRHRCYVHFERLKAINGQFDLYNAFRQLEKMTRIERLMEVMVGTNAARDTTRRLRRWHRQTAKLTACDLRKRYLLARRAFYQRQEILNAWRMSAAAQQHARRMSMLLGVRQLRANSREKNRMRRCAVRAMGMWTTTLANRVCRAWRLHTETAKMARLEIIRARANQTALDAHRRRARARALSAIVTSWHIYASSRAEVRVLSDAAANANRRRTGFDRWHLRAVFASRKMAADGIAMFHARGGALRESFELWKVQAKLKGAHAEILLTMFNRHAASTKLMCLLAWRGLIVRHHKLAAIHMRWSGRLLDAVVMAWRKQTQRSIALDEQVGEMAAEARKLRMRLALEQWKARELQELSRNTLALEQVARKMRGGAAVAIGKLHRHATCLMAASVVAARWRAGHLAGTVTHWRQQLQLARRQMKHACAHALAGRARSTMTRWKRFHSNRANRRQQLMASAAARLQARQLGACGEVVRMWRAVSVCTRRERRDTAVALDTMRALAAASSGVRQRMSSAFAYYCKRLAGLVFFHWRALSWSRNWEKPGRFSEDGFDVAERIYHSLGRREAELADSSLQSRHARMAAHLVKGAVIHQRRSTLQFQRSNPPSPRMEPREAGLGSPGKGSPSKSPAGARSGSSPASPPRRSLSPPSRMAGSPLRPPSSARGGGFGGGMPKHALSPTGLSVALVLGSQMLEDAPPDDDLELAKPFATSRLARLQSRESHDAAPADGVGRRARPPRAGAALADVDVDGSEAGSERDATIRRTPATLTPLGGSPRRTAMADPSGFQTLEQFARLEKQKRG